MGPTATVEPSDEVLIRRVRAGDDHAFGVLFARYAGILERRVGRIVPDTLRRRVSTSDVLQEARIVALDRWGDFEDRGRGAVRNWLVGIVENKAREAVRGAVAEKRNALAEASRGHRPDTAHFVGAGPTPSEAAMGRELEMLARRAMGELPADYRLVLRLVREEDRDLKAVAVRMGRTHDAVKQLHRRALLRFTAVFDRMRRGSS